MKFLSKKDIESNIKLLDEAAGKRSIDRREWAALQQSCRALGGVDKALPALKRFADSCWKLKLVFKGKHRPHIRVPSYWKGPPAVVACRVILDTEGVSLQDESHPYVRKAGGIISNAAEALDELDRLKNKYTPLDEYDREAFNEKYWDICDEVESDIEDMLYEVDEEMFCVEGNALQHVFRNLERFDFATAPKYSLRGYHKAFDCIDEIETPRVRRDVVMLAERASSSDKLPDYEEEFLALSNLVVEKEFREALPYLKKIARRKTDITGNPYMQMVDDREDAVVIIACAAILHLEGKSVKGNSLYARKARNALASSKSELDCQFDICMHTDVGDGLESENRVYGQMKHRFEHLKAILYGGAQ